jgi:DNA-binding transcriptional MerR regulator
VLRIGAFSKLSQVSIKTLRYYDEIGLLKPVHVDRFTGYRYYSSDQLLQLRKLLAFKDIGFSLQQIESLLEDGLSAARLYERLAVQRAELASRVVEGQSQLARLEQMLQQIERNGELSSIEIKIRDVETALIASIRRTVPSYDDTVNLFQELGSYLKKEGLKVQWGAVWHACDLENKSIDCEAFAFLPHLIPFNNRVRMYQLPAARMVSVIHSGQGEDYAPSYSAAHSWISENKYRIAGPNREVYLDGGYVNDGGAGLMEIQFPVLTAQPSASFELS